MNPTKAALNKIAEGIYELADAMFAETAPQAPRSDPAAISHALEASPFVDIPDEVFDPAARPQGSLSQCPSHKARYLSGKYGEYCPARSDDPAWANKKGYCTITPENAAEWLRITAA